MTGLLHLTEEDKSIKSTKSLLEKLLGKVGCSMWKWQGVDSWDIIGPLYMPIRMLWMIWNIAEERKKNKKNNDAQSDIQIGKDEEEEEYWKPELGEVKVYNNIKGYNGPLSCLCSFQK